MYERILAAVDGSVISQSALTEAVRLARALGARLCLAYGVDAVTTNAYKQADREQFVAPQVEAGRAILAKAAAVAEAAGVLRDERLLEIDAIGRGRLPEALARAAEAWQADLMVVGTHGRRGVSHLLLGSVAEGVVHIAPTPVLVVPAQAAATEAGAARELTNLLVAVDGTEVSEHAQEEAIRVADSLKMTLRVVSVADTQADAAAGSQAEAVLGAARARAETAGVVVETRTLEAPHQPGTVVEAVISEAAAWPAHLIVLGTHGRQGLERLRLGSVAEAILRQAPAPVLLVRASGAASAAA
jgi:nucleotide-binding universal stress UspA family protein